MACRGQAVADRSEASVAIRKERSGLSTPLTASRRSRRRPSCAGTRDRYARLMRLIATDRCVILDGANGTELIEIGRRAARGRGAPVGPDRDLDAPAHVKAVHRRYVDVGCDVISTNTWGLPTALRDGGVKLCGVLASRCTGWTSRAARCGSRAPRPTRPAAATRWPSRSASTATSTRRTAARRSACWRARSSRTGPI